MLAVMRSAFSPWLRSTMTFLHGVKEGGGNVVSERMVVAVAEAQISTLLCPSRDEEDRLRGWGLGCGWKASWRIVRICALKLFPSNLAQYLPSLVPRMLIYSPYVWPDIFIVSLRILLFTWLSVKLLKKDHVAPPKLASSKHGSKKKNMRVVFCVDEDEGWEREADEGWEKEAVDDAVCEKKSEPGSCLSSRREAARGVGEASRSPPSPEGCRRR
jgi:hypothetical protein